MDDSRSGAGGKFVVSRRKQRLSRTPYDRPLPSPLQPQPARSPNWFSGIIVPSARAVASGARKIISSVLYTESESSSEDEDEDAAAEDNLDNDQDHEITHDGVGNLNELSETKQVIEQLIMKETFSREECDSFTKVLKSRVIDRSTNADRELGTSPWKMINEDDDSYNKAVLEAKKWFQEKKMESNSSKKTDKNMCNVNPCGLENVDNAVGSPVDVARSYMRGRPPWASSTKQIELRTPLTTTMELFKEGTSYSVGHDPTSSSKKWNSLASGSWNIQDELRKVRSKATEEMLQTPPSKVDPSLYATATNNHESDGGVEEIIGGGKRLTEPDSFKQTQLIGVLMDTGVSTDPAISALGSRQDGEASEERSSKSAARISSDDEDSGAVQINGDCSKAEEWYSDLNSGKISGLSANKVAEIGGKQIDNGIPLSLVSTNQGKQHEGNYVTNENKTTPSIINLEGNCELLTEACVEVPIITETDSIASGSQSSKGKQYDEFTKETIRPTNTKAKADVIAGEKQSTKSVENLRRSRRRVK